MALPKVLFNIARDGLGRTATIQKTTGLIATGVGFLIMTNLHATILRFIFKAVFPSL